MPPKDKHSPKTNKTNETEQETKKRSSRKQDHDEKISKFQKTINGETLLTSCKEGNIEVVEFLLSQGAEIEETEKDGWTPLYIACFFPPL